MKKFFFCVCILALGFSATQAQTAPAAPTAAVLPLAPAQRQAVEELLTVMQMEKKYKLQRERMKLMEDEMMKNDSHMKSRPAEVQAYMKATRAKTRAYMESTRNWEAIKEDKIQAYGHTFTLEELRSLTAFYKSPVGQMYLSKEAELEQRSLELNKRRTEDARPGLERIINSQNQIRKFNKAIPTFPVPGP